MAKINFSDTESYFTVLNYGNDGCEVNFNAQGIRETVDCEASMTSLDNGWNRLEVRMKATPENTVHVYLTPPTILKDEGSIIVDEIIISR